MALWAHDLQSLYRISDRPDTDNRPSDRAWAETLARVPAWPGMDK